MAWHDTYDRIKPFLVRISSEGFLGTGFLLAYNQDHSVAAIATAAHVVEHANDWRKPLKIWHCETNEFSFYEEQDRFIWINTQRDSAAILISSNSLTLPSSALPLMDASKYKKIGVEVGWTGFPALVPHELCFFSGKISSFLIHEECYLIDGVAINGASGGPVFDSLNNSSPEIVGVVSAYISSHRPGETLPGLLRAQDVTTFHEHIQMIKSIDEAREKEREQEKIQKETKDPDSKQAGEAEM